MDSKKIHGGASRFPRARGVVAVEFAFVLILLLLILSGIVEFGRAMWYANVLTKATRDGARVISAWDPTDLDNGLQASRTRVVDTANASRISPPLGVNDVAIECDYSTGTSPAFSFTNCRDTVVPVSVRLRIISYQFPLGQWMPFIGAGGLINLGTVNLTPSTTMPYMR